MSLGYDSTFSEGGVKADKNSSDDSGQFAGGRDTTAAPGIAHIQRLLVDWSSPSVSETTPVIRNLGVDNIETMLLYQKATNSLFSHECEPTVCKYMYMCMCVHIS